MPDLLQQLLNNASTLGVFLLGILDSMPAPARALLVGYCLYFVLRKIELRIPAAETRFSETFRKAALLLLLALPLFILLFPNSRPIFYAEVLPESDQMIGLFWWSLVSAWASGVVWHAVRHRHTTPATPATPAFGEPAPDSLNNRLAHWARQLAISDAPQTYVDTGSAPRLDGRGIHLPATTVQLDKRQLDITLLHLLALHHVRIVFWTQLARLVRTVYWPGRWLDAMNDRLDDNLALSASELAQACYRDNLGFDSALNKLSTRWPDAASPAWSPTRAKNLRSARDKQERQRDPYDRVIALVGIAAFVAFLAGGPTLHRPPPQVEEAEAPVFNEQWNQSLRRRLDAEEIPAMRRPRSGELVGSAQAGRSTLQDPTNQ